MYHARVFNLMVALAVAFLLTLGGAVPRHAGAASAKKLCIKANCKAQDKKQCIKGYKEVKKAAQALCAKKDRKCRKRAAKAFKANKKRCTSNFGACKKCCKSGATACLFAPLCGNLRITAGEACDDGDLDDGDGCDSNCTLTACGNGIVTAGEECDDGNSTDGDGCDSNCTLTACGNGIVTAGEACDDGNLTDGDGCDSNCVPTGCGNGKVTANEACDDGNSTDGDGCDSNCTLTACGNGIVTAGEACDDGGESAACDADCTPAQCGDGTFNAQAEACDDGGESATCDADCTPAQCGDGTVNTTAGEECESDADCGPGGACRADCTCAVATCGDGVLDTGEECDGAAGQCDFGACTSECLCPPCDCCATGRTLLRFETGLASGTGGKLQNFRCTNANTVACVDDADCDLGYCIAMFGICSGDTSVSCTTDTDCGGTCAEQSGVGLPLDLVLGGLYTGGGKNSVPLPLPVPDKGVSWTRVVACDGDTMTLGPTTPAEAGQVGCTTGRTCSGTGTTCVLDSDCPAAETCVTNCIFGPQLPIPNSSPGNEATSVCTINDVGGDASGTTQCTGGDSTVTIKLRSVVFLNGDLLSSSKGPVDVPGIQPCPVCTRQCVGGADDRLPCADGSECDSGTCSAGTSCLGGPGDGNACTPDTSGADVLGAAFPTSHDCSMDPNQIITGSIGGLPVDLTLTTGSIVVDAVDQPNGPRTFSGFCRDVVSSGSLCFEGDPDTACPVAGDSNGVPCSSDADCSAPFESCAQTSPGAFSKAAATRISAAGSTDGGCLADGQPHAASVVSVFDIAPTFNKLVDSAGDIPGPGAALLTGEALLTDTVQ